MSDQPLEYVLPERRPRSGEDPLVAFLTASQHAPVRICAAAVEMLDSLRLRTLLAAQKHWAEKELAFAVVNTSDSFRNGLTRLGVGPTQFDTEEN